MRRQTISRTIFVLFITSMILSTGFSSHAYIFENDHGDSQIVPLSDVTLVATNFLQRKQNQHDYSIQNIEILHDKNQDVCIGYLVHLSPQGYLVIAPETSIQPIIAYSFNTNAPMNTLNNPFYHLLEADITAQLMNFDMMPSNQKRTMIDTWESYITSKPEADLLDEFQQWPPEGSTSTQGWIETTWNQDDPYNAFCPIDPTEGGARSVAGCPAITMGQILHYHRTINHVQFDDSDDYHHQYLSSFMIDDDHIGYDFPSFPELNELLLTVEDHYDNNSEITDDDIASICFACGIAAEQVYSSAMGSGTFGVDQAFDAYQRFSCDTATLYYQPDNGVLDVVIDNIKQALPVHFAIVNSQWDAGHNLIIDGYNTDGYFHLNFGWDGTYDGWYFIPDDLPFQLTVIEGYIVDILKTTTSEDLQVNGSMIWQEKTGGETVQGSFTIENVGEQNSLLTWEVVNVPEWGNWTITPSNGHSLRPIDGQVSIQLSCILPDEKRKDYDDSITIVNSNNPSDRGYIPISLSLPKEKSGLSWIFDILLQQFPWFDSLLRVLF